ncbi:WD40-repeat-containing domain protein [Mortierella sp. GBAus27b]|nr:ddb1 and cul4 associated factor 7 [Mortierella sp. GBA43]KAI8359480.1 WD40-repeat-containing domain protein [Mortierella sp. GBAus27b]
MASPQTAGGPATFAQGYMSSSSSSPSASGHASSSRLVRKEILSYSAPWPVYGLDWSNQPTEREALRLAVGSFIEDGSNKIQVITLQEFAGIDGKDYNPTSMSDWVAIAETTNQQYPVTKIKWEPFKAGHRRSSDLLATTGDYLRLWDLKDGLDGDNNSSNTIGRRHPPLIRQQLTQRGVLANTKASFCAPLTSFDWNTYDPALIVTSSIDTTCTVWNVETQQAKTQLIAHDKEVYDVTFANNNPHIFASVGADGSVRMFDLRALEHSTIIYETTSSIPGLQPSNPQLAAQPSIPLLRLSFNKLDPNYLSTFHMDSSSVQILDIRVPGIPISELRGHKGAVNCMAWSPHNTSEIATGSDDHQVFIWEVNQMRHDRGDELDHHTKTGSNSGNPKAAVTITSTRVLHEPYRAANVGGEVNQLSWSSASPDWVAVGFGRTVQALRL